MISIQRLFAPVILIFGVVLSPNWLAGAVTKNPVAAEEVLHEAMAARGDRDAWLSIHSFHAKGTVYFQTPSGPWWDAPNITNEWPLEVQAMRPNKFRFNTDLKSTQSASTVFVPPRYYENGFDGQTAWEACPGRTPQKLGGIFGVERQELAEVFAWCAEPQNYRSITNLGACDFHGRRCYELEMVRKSGNPESNTMTSPIISLRALSGAVCSVPAWNVSYLAITGRLAVSGSQRALIIKQKMSETGDMSTL